MTNGAASTAHDAGDDVNAWIPEMANARPQLPPFDPAVSAAIDVGDVDVDAVLGPLDIHSGEPDAPGAGSTLGLALDAFLAIEPGPASFFGPIVEGGIAIHVGRPETFKTFGSLQLGFAGACGGSWLGYELGEPRPFVYVSAEKSRSTVRDRLTHLAAAMPPAAPVWVVHRAGITFGDKEGWGRLRELVGWLGPRTFVVVDTIASVAGPGFDENNGRDMAVVLGALRQLADLGATVAALHHPSKHGDGVGGIRMRGHTSLWGEIDATLEFTRPDRAVEAGLVRVEPKDGDLRLIPFRWRRETFLLEEDAGILALTPTAIAAVVEALYDGTGLKAEAISARFPGSGRTVVLDRIAEAVRAGLIARTGQGRATAYIPMPRSTRPDDSDSAAVRRDPVQATFDDVPTANRPDAAGPSTHESSGPTSNRPPSVRAEGTGGNHPSAPGGLYNPRADDSQPDGRTDHRAPVGERLADVFERGRDTEATA